MNKTCILALSSLLFFFSNALHAATLIESKEAHTGLQKTWIDGTRLRVETEEEGQYMLMDFTRRTMYIVNLGRSQAVDMSKVVTDHSAQPQKVNTSEYTVIHTGHGPSIAEYETEHYTVSHSGKKCFEAFTSLKAVKEMELEHFISGMNEMFPRDIAVDTGGDPCLNAENALDYKTIGLPLRLIGLEGAEIYNITRMEKNTTVPTNGFAVPEGFTVIDYGQMVLQMMPPDQQ